MSKKLLMAFAIVSIVGLLSLSAAAAGDAEKGKSLARGCTCHRNDLDGMPEQDIVKKMEGFKDGSLENKIMNRLAGKYTREQIEDIAAWFASK